MEFIENFTEIFENFLGWLTQLTNFIKEDILLSVIFAMIIIRLLISTYKYLRKIF